MATHASAEKAQRKSEKRRARNRAKRATIAVLIKKVLGAQNRDGATKLFQSAQSAIHKAARTHLLHRNNAARKISRLARHIKSLAA